MAAPRKTFISGKMPGLMGIGARFHATLKLDITILKRTFVGEIKSMSKIKKIKSSKTPPANQPLKKLDIGCGPNKKGPEWIGVDQTKFTGVDVVCDLNLAWPFGDGSAEEIHSSHCIEHFDAVQRVHVYNEMFRVLKPGGKATIIAPFWSSGRAYGDPTHKWPPVSGFSFYYLLKSWRMANAPHSDFEHWKSGYKCDFDVTWGFGMHQSLQARNQEYQQFALTFYVEAAQDVIATLVKRS